MNFALMDEFADVEPVAEVPVRQSGLAEALTIGLNGPQAEAVRQIDGPLLVLAGAGTGKTSVLTRRVAYILLTKSAWPSEILAVTFTNKAAKEMGERTEKLMMQAGMGHEGGVLSGMWMGTFHRLGMRMLRAHAERVGLKPNFVVLDSDDQQKVVAQVLKDAGVDVQQFPPRLVTSIFSRFKDNGWRASEVPTEEAGGLAALGAGRALALYGEYNNRLLALNACDFGDLLLHPLVLMENFAEVAEKYRKQFKYVLVDEYQDTNVVQYRWLKALASGHGNLCVVGDDDQSIYGWRGAQVGNILRFEKDFSGAKVIRLEQNYRSTGHILAAANGLIANNRSRHGKNLWTDGGDGNQLELHPQLDDREEARFVADGCWQHVRGGGAYDDIAVLVRTAAQTRAIEEAFVRGGLPYVVVGGLKFYERKEIKDALAYLRLVVNEADDLALGRIINVPRRGVGEGTLALIEEAARAGTGQVVAIRGMIERGELTGKVANSLHGLIEKLSAWRLLAQMDTPDRVAERVLEESGYLQMLRDDREREEEAKTRIENLKELLRALQEYSDLPSFLDHVALVSDGDATTDNAVKLMTIHSAKGLEFPLVFLPGFEEGLFPHQRALNEEGQKGLEEERRLAYVAITRAKKRLVLSYAHGRRMWGQFLPGAPSRFLAEIPGEHVKHFRGPVGVGSGMGGSFDNPFGGGFGGGLGGRPQVGSRMDRQPEWKRAREPFLQGGGQSRRQVERVDVDTEYSQESEFEREEGGLKVGMRVHHAKFGAGRVEAMEGTGAELKVVVAFKQAGTKKLLASLANLTVLG